MSKVFQVDGMEEMLNLVLAVFGSKVTNAKADILNDRHVGKERIILENHSDPPLFWGEKAVSAAYQTLIKGDAPVSNAFKASDAS